MGFRIGDCVKVKDGIMCPDCDSLCIGRWQGRISAVEKDDDIVGIEWDSITLKQLPRAYIKESEEEGLDWTEMYLSVDEIESASPRDSKHAADKIRREMQGKFCRLADNTEGERIFNVISGGGDELEAWHDHLAKVLSFPFEATVSEHQDAGSADYGDKMVVHRFANR